MADRRVVHPDGDGGPIMAVILAIAAAVVLVVFFGVVNFSGESSPYVSADVREIGPQPIRRRVHHLQIDHRADTPRRPSSSRESINAARRSP
jgi:negative regulator of sigma E activity